MKEGLSDVQEVQRKEKYMIEPKKRDNEDIAFRDEDVRGNALKEAFQKAEQTVVKKFQEPRVLVECNLIVEVSQSVATKGKHANYIAHLIRGMLEQNKNIKNIIDVDAFEPEAEIE